MNQRPKLLLDENIGRPLTESIASVLEWHESEPEVWHLLQFEKAGTPDPEWLKRAADDDWVILSADRGKRYGGGKLPLLCLEYRITHILIRTLAKIT